MHVAGVWDLHTLPWYVRTLVQDQMHVGKQNKASEMAKLALKHTGKHVKE